MKGGGLKSARQLTDDHCLTCTDNGYQGSLRFWGVFETDHSLLLCEVCACLPKKRKTVAGPKHAVQLLTHDEVREQL
jgi:hypothetical protein